MGRGLAQGDRAEADRAAGGALSPASVRGVTSTRKTRRYAPGQKLAAQEIDTMTRFLIFAAMAPPLGFVVAFWVMLQVANWLAGSPNTFDVAQIMMLPTIYLVGLIPALLAAWFDHALAKRNVSYRIALTALFGYAISYLPLAMAYWVGFAHGPEVLLFGLIGAVPSAVCSWLATEGKHLTLFHHHDRIRSSGRV
jgi:hypothetical protein